MGTGLMGSYPKAGHSQAYPYILLLVFFYILVLCFPLKEYIFLVRHSISILQSGNNVANERGMAHMIHMASCCPSVL